MTGWTTDFQAHMNDLPDWSTRSAGPLVAVDAACGTKHVPSLRVTCNLALWIERAMCALRSLNLVRNYVRSSMQNVSSFFSILLFGLFINQSWLGLLSRILRDYVNYLDYRKMRRWRSRRHQNFKFSSSLVPTFRVTSTVVHFLLSMILVWPIPVRRWSNAFAIESTDYSYRGWLTFWFPPLLSIPPKGVKIV